MRACVLSRHDGAAGGGMLAKREIASSQAAVTQGQKVASTGFGTASSGANVLYRVEYRARWMLWSPDEARELNVRLLICAHVGAAGHRGMDPTLERLRGNCVWRTTQDDVQEILRQCLHCAEYKAGTVVLSPLASTVQRTRVCEVVRFDFVHFAESSGGGYSRWIPVCASPR